MKKMTAFFSIALLVCIATFVAFASNINRDASYCFRTREAPDDFPGRYSDESNTGSDCEGPLYSTGSSWFGYYFNDNGDLKCAASGYGYVSCSTDNENYETTYSLYAKVPEGLQNPNVRNPQTLPKDGSFTDSVYRSGEGNGALFSMGGAKGSASANGNNRSNGDQHNTSAASPTPETAGYLEDIDG